MVIENNIDTILDELVKKGSNISDLKEFKKEITAEVKKDQGLADTLASISSRIKEQTEAFLDQKNKNNTNYISGISACIYLPDQKNMGEYKIKLIGGNRSRNCDLKIDENTMFDVASITKLFTLLLLFKLDELKLINLNTKVSKLNPDFQNLEDYTLNDLVRLHGVLYTNGNVATAESEQEAYRILHTLYLKDNTREKNTYNDFGAIVIGDTIAKVLSEKLGREMTFNDIMQDYLIKPLYLENTMFNPTSQNISGNNGMKVHDPKARILGGAVGNAGIFTTSDDLARLAREIYSLRFVNRYFLNKLGEITFEGSAKGNLGLYLKHPSGYDLSFTPPEYATGSFSHQGWTGAVATFDPKNYIHSNFLVNAIYEDDNPDLVKNNKPIDFVDAFTEYEANVTRNVMLMYVAKQYYNRYCKDIENIYVTEHIR